MLPLRPRLTGKVCVLQKQFLVGSNLSEGNPVLVWSAGPPMYPSVPQTTHKPVQLMLSTYPTISPLNVELFWLHLQQKYVCHPVCLQLYSPCCLTMDLFRVYTIIWSSVINPRGHVVQRTSATCESLTGNWFSQRAANVVTLLCYRNRIRFSHPIYP